MAVKGPVNSKLVYLLRRNLYINILARKIVLQIYKKEA